MSDEPAVKPGKKTSEHLMAYIMTAVAVAVGSILSFNLPEEDALVKVAAFLAPILASMGYSFSRGKAKQQATKILMFALILPVLLAGCTCTLQKQALEELDDTQDLIFPEYMELIEKKFADHPDRIKNRKDLVSTAEELLDKLKKQTE